MAGDTGLADWPIEEIPNDEVLSMRVEKSWIQKDGSPMPGVFRNRGGAMSTDWEKYSTPAETRARGKVASNNGVIELGVGAVRGIRGQSVEHTPNVTENNRSHADVAGEKDTEARFHFLKIFRWVDGLRYEPPFD